MSSKKTVATTAGKASQSQTKAPAAYIIDRETGERVDAVAPALVRAAMAAWDMVQRIDALEADLKVKKEELAKALDGRSLIVTGVCRVAVARTESVSITDADKLRELLGDRFDDLVTQTVSYKPADALLEMAADGDDPMAPAYRGLMKVRIGTTVRITAER